MIIDGTIGNTAIPDNRAWAEKEKLLLEKI
jgi:hypothetical protein